jgi:hypothetical protein
MLKGAELDPFSRLAGSFEAPGANRAVIGTKP